MSHVTWWNWSEAKEGMEYNRVSVLLSGTNHISTTMTKLVDSKNSRASTSWKMTANTGWAISALSRIILAKMARQDIVQQCVATKTVRPHWLPDKSQELSPLPSEAVSVLFNSMLLGPG